MAKKSAVECADQLLQDIMESPLPFGGKAFVGLGDFQQVAPVIHGSSGPSIMLINLIQSSYLWQHFHILHLTIPIHYVGNPAYIYWVDQVGDRVSPYETIVDLSHLEYVSDMDAVARFLFLDNNIVTLLNAVHRAFLSPFNARVDQFNELLLANVDGSSSM
jgi:hypothetical protein